jgi:hypothetical protein
MGLFSALLKSITEPGKQVVAVSLLPGSRKKGGNKGIHLTQQELS